MGFAIANISILYSYLIIYCIFKLFEPLILLTNTFDNLHYKYMAPSLVMKYFLFSYIKHLFIIVQISSKQFSYLEIELQQFILKSCTFYLCCKSKMRAKKAQALRMNFLKILFSLLVGFFLGNFLYHNEIFLLDKPNLPISFSVLASLGLLGNISVSEQSLSSSSSSSSFLRLFDSTS